MYVHSYSGLLNVLNNVIGFFFKNWKKSKTQTITKASLPQNKNGYWSIIVCTISSKYGRNCSKCPMSVNSMGISVGHQQIAKFLLSMLFSLEFSETLQDKSKHTKWNCFDSGTHHDSSEGEMLTERNAGKCI